MEGEQSTALSSSEDCQYDMTLDDMLNLDLAYAPPFSPVWDPVLVAARKALAMLEAKPSPAGEFPVVLAPGYGNAARAFALDTDTGEQRWSLQGSYVYAPKVPLGDDVFMIDDWARTCSRVEAATGDVRWTTDIGVRALNTGAAVHEGIAWVHGTTGELTAVDLDSGAVALFSVDRYMRGFPLPDELSRLWRSHCRRGEGWQYLNALYRCGTDRIARELAALYPDARDPAATAVRAALGELLGLHVDYHALVDMGGFVGLVDALGGVEVHVARPVRVRLSPPHEGAGWRSFRIDTGVQQLDGAEALAFVRSRTGSSDADRMRRQRCLVTAVTERADALRLLSTFPALADAIEGSVVTNIPLALLPDLVELTDRVDVDRRVTVGLTRPHYQRASLAPDRDAIHAAVRQALDDPEAVLAQQPTAEGAAEVCH
jgi:LCP family protein required for cell wall assembly